MIIKGLRLRSTSGVKKLMRHLQNADDNECVRFVQGTPDDVHDMHADAVAHSSMYSVRHWIVSPQQPINQGQFWQVVKQLGREFEFDIGQAVIVEHRKPRTCGTGSEFHWHVLVGETDPVTGRVLRSKHDFIIHELVARWSEDQFGHPVVVGRHNRAVESGLRKRGFQQAADALRFAAQRYQHPPLEAFSHTQHQEKRRAGINLPFLRRLVRAEVAAANAPRFLRTALAKHGLKIAVGKKPGTYIIETADGDLVGALHRLAGKRKSEINALMELPNVPSADAITHTDSNSERASICSKPSGASGRPPNGRTGDDDNHTEKSVGWRRAGSRGYSGAPPSTGASQRQSKSPTVAQFRSKLAIYRAELTDQLATANTLSSTSVDQVAHAIIERQEDAERALMMPIEDFDPKQHNRELRHEIQDILSRRSEAARDLKSVERAIDDAPRLAWWCYCIGLAASRRRRLEQLERTASEQRGHLVAIDAELRRRSALLEARTKVAEKRHVEQIKVLAEQQKIARRELPILTEALNQLNDDPDAARGGLAHYLLAAEKRYHKKISEEVLGNKIAKQAYSA